MLRVLVVATALVLAGGGCTADEEPVARPTPTTPATSPTTAPTEEALPCVPGAQPFTGPAADEFGSERVMEAYCMLAQLAGQQETTSLARPIPRQTARNLWRLKGMLTSRAARRWEQQVEARAAGDPEATERVNGLTLHDVRRVPEGYVGADDGPYVFGTRVGPATAALARGGRALALTFTLDTGVVLEEEGDTSGRHSLLPVTREATYVLVDRGGRWLIDDWDAEFEHGPVRLASG